jgi:adenylate kinase
MVLATIFINSQPQQICLWRYLKDSVYRTNLHRVHEMKEEISSLFTRITADMVGRVIQIVNFQQQLQIIVDAGGSYNKYDSTDRLFSQVYWTN